MISKIGKVEESEGGYIVHTGAWESALNINIAPKISIRKPTNQDLLKAYALITWMPMIKIINYKNWLTGHAWKSKGLWSVLKRKNLELEREWGKNDGALFLKNFADVVSGGCC